LLKADDLPIAASRLICRGAMHLGKLSTGIHRGRLASDKLFYFLFQSQPDLILRWLRDLPEDAGGYSFSAPVLKEREYRLDGLFSPPVHRDDLPAVILEAQMAVDRGFLLRLYAESARFLQQERWQRDWRVLVICPHRHLDFGAHTPVQEFIEHRVSWIELQPREGEPPREPLTQVLSLCHGRHHPRGFHPEPRLPGDLWPGRSPR